MMLDTMNAATAPLAFACLLNAPSTNIPTNAPCAIPIKLLNHSLADLISPLAKNIATMIAKIPIPKEMY